MYHFDLSGLICDYGDIPTEVLACREECALFDFSFMASARLTGQTAQESLQGFQSRRLENLQTGQVRYSLRLDRQARVLADLTVWKLADECFELFSGRQVDITDLQALQEPHLKVQDFSAHSAIFALQGPRSLQVLQSVSNDPDKLARLDYFQHVSCSLAGQNCLIGRLGYTGELGYEIIIWCQHGPQLWALLAQHAKPAGFAAANCLRIEAGFILFAHECLLQPRPNELGLARFAPLAKIEKPRFQLVCFEAESALSRTQLALWQPDPAFVRSPEPGEITITSACYSPRSESVLGLGFVHPETLSKNGELLDPQADFTAISPVQKPYYRGAQQRRTQTI